MGRLGQIGQVNWVSGEGDDVEVQVGSMKVLVPVEDLFVQEDGDDSPKKPSHKGQVYLSPITREKPWLFLQSWMYAGIPWTKP